MTKTRPRLVILKGSVPMDASQVQTLKSVFDVIEVQSPDAARKMLDGSVGGLVICAPGEYLAVPGEPLPTAEPTILQRIGEGIGVVNAQGTLLWTDARFKVHDEEVRREFVQLCREAIDVFNQPPGPDGSITRPPNTRLSFVCGDSHFELVACPATMDEANRRVSAVVGVLWDVTASAQLQSKLDAIDAAGADLLRIDSASIKTMNLADRLKMLEQKIIRQARETLGFENFEIRLLDRESVQLELVIAVNISPLKIGEVLYAKEEGNGISGYVAATGHSYICPNVADEPLYREGLDNSVSTLTVPLLLHDTVVGTFNIESTKINAFDETDCRFAEIFGRYVAAAMNILDLLVVERYTATAQISEVMTDELTIPLDELTHEATELQQSPDATQAAKDGLARILETVKTLRSRIDRCTSGPKTIIGAEQELHRATRDPKLVGRRILITDDEPAIRDTLHALLVQKGCDVTACSSGSEAIAALKTAQEDGTSFDLVISDIKMPDRNGYEIYRTVKSINENTPVILMTGFGYDPNHCIVRASQEGLQSFLFKPFKASQLLEVMTKNLPDQ